MKDDSIEELKAKMSNLQEQNSRQLKELREYIRAEEVMIAAGLISKTKVEQAHEIVRGFTS